MLALVLYSAAGTCTGQRHVALLGFLVKVMLYPREHELSIFEVFLTETHTICQGVGVCTCL